MSVGFDSTELVGEHIYPVVSILKANGFKNIKSIAIKDIDNKNKQYRFQVEQIVINGIDFFEENSLFTIIAKSKD